MPSEFDEGFEEERLRAISQDVIKRQGTRVRHRHVKELLSRITASRGLAQQQTNHQLHQAWSSAVGPAIDKLTQVSNVRRGVLQVTVSNSIVAQELGFQKQSLVNRLQNELPDAGIRDLRFRVGPLNS